MRTYADISGTGAHESTDRVPLTHALEVRRLYDALKAAAYYIERLEMVQQRKRVRDMCEAMEHYHREALPLIATYDKEMS